MFKEEKLSLNEIKLLVVGFVFGGLAVTSPTKAAHQDAWLAQIISWLLGCILIAVYLPLIRFNNKKTLIEMLKECFGKYLGSIIGIFYVIYFIHLASITIRIFGEYMVSVSYPTFSVATIICFLFLGIIYSLKKGILVCTRVNSLFIPLVLVVTILTIAASAVEFDFNNLLPVLEGGFGHVVKIGFRTFALSFGNLVVFLMIFPNVVDQEGIGKSTYKGVTIIGLLLLGIVLRNLLVLGPHILPIQLFPPHVTLSLIPWAVLDPLISVNVLSGVGIKTIVFIYCAAIGICQIVGLEDYKLIVIPLCVATICFAMWLYPNYPALYRWVERNMVFYAAPFQVIIPLILLIISLIKNRKPKKKEVC